MRLVSPVGLLVTCLFTLGPAGAAARSAADVQDPDDPRWCRSCHDEPRLAASAMDHAAHQEVTCRECHKGYQFDPHEKPRTPPEGDVAALVARGVAIPEAWTSCVDCHDLPDETAGLFPHGKADPAKGPFCGDCHGDVHSTPLSKSLTPGDRRRAMTERCESCHEDAARMQSTAVAAAVVAGWDHSIHARHLKMGSDDSPGCADCHGGHELVDLSRDGEKICKKCHEDVTPAFVGLATHGPYTPDKRPVSFWTQKFFAWLTFSVILLLAVHVLLDVTAVLRRALRARTPEIPADLTRGARLLQATGVADEKGRVRRFDIHQRIMHGMMAASFTLLVLTGWPLSYHDVAGARSTLELFGGLHTAGVLHRIGGVVMILCAVYHLVYLTVLVIRRKPCMTMMPTLQDVRHLAGNIGWFLGLKKERPRFGRYAYFEKFDYWAVFWGVIIMAGSGLIRWFPEQVARYAPAWVYEIGFLAHADEALLAGLAIFLWHFYNVHLRPAVFPMSWVFLHGRMTVHELAEEHGGEYDALVAGAERELAQRQQPPPPGKEAA